ncbi:hypothetical protein Tco_0451460 [Tanacetum coccineum]
MRSSTPPPFDWLPKPVHHRSYATRSPKQRPKQTPQWENLGNYLTTMENLRTVLAIEDAEYKGDKIEFIPIGRQRRKKMSASKALHIVAKLDHVINVNLMLMKTNITAKRVITAGSPNFDGTYTYRGYSDHMVCEEHFVLRWPDNLPLDSGAPLIAECKDNINEVGHENVGVIDTKRSSSCGHESSTSFRLSIFVESGNSGNWKANPMALRLLEKLIAFDLVDRIIAEEISFSLGRSYFYGLANLKTEPPNSQFENLSLILKDKD